MASAMTGLLPSQVARSWSRDRVAGLLAVLAPVPSVTTTVNTAPSSAGAMAGSVQVASPAPAMGAPFRYHW